jgi:hypothetical protein
MCHIGSHHSRAWVAKQLEVFWGEVCVGDKAELTEPHVLWLTGNMFFLVEQTGTDSSEEAQKANHS